MISENKQNWIILGLLVLGALLRIHLYVIGRGLWLDEAMVAVGILRLDLPMITDVLDYRQQAPVGYVLLVKLATVLFGDGPQALRLPALLAGLGVLPLVWYGVRKLRLRFGAQLLVLGLVTVNPYLIYYSNEVKQYSFDALFAAAVLAVFVSDTRWRYLLLLALVTVGLYFSHPLVFVAAAAIVAEWQRGGVGDMRHFFRRILPMGLLFMLFFIAHYFLFVRQSIDAYHTHWYTMNYHREFFMPLNIWNTETLLWYPRTATRFMTHLLYFHLPLFGWVVLFAGATHALLKKGWRPVAVFLILSFGFAAAASSLQLYTLKTPRMMLYGASFMALLVGFGAHAFLQWAEVSVIRVFGPPPRSDLWTRFRTRLQRPLLLGAVAALFVIGVLAPLGVRAWRMLDWQRYGYREEIREVFPRWHREQREGDGTYVHYRVEPIVRYNCVRVGRIPDYPVHDHIPDEHLADSVLTSVGKRGWAFFSGTDFAYRRIEDALNAEYRIRYYWSHDSSAVLLRMEAREE